MYARRLRFAFVLPAILALGYAALVRAEDKPVDKKAAAPPKGQRVFVAGHSFIYFMPPILNDIAKSAGIKDHVAAGLSAIGGSRVYQHWDVVGAKNECKKQLTAGAIDVLELSPIHLPDDGIEKFVNIAVEHNPKVRVTLQEFWLPFDIYDTTFTKRPKNVDHNVPTIAELRKLHDPYFKSMDEYVASLNKKLGKDVVYIVPVGQAVLALREKIVDGKAFGITKQSELFGDDVGHATAPLEVLDAYCHFAVVYGRSPVGLPMPARMKNAKKPQWDEKLNRLLQEIAWDAVTQHSMSGVKKEG